MADELSVPADGLKVIDKVLSNVPRAVVALFGKTDMPMVLAEEVLFHVAFYIEGHDVLVTVDGGEPVVKRIVKVERPKPDG